jgi:hypothetical protein
MHPLHLLSSMFLCGIRCKAVRGRAAAQEPDEFGMLSHETGATLCVQPDLQVQRPLIDRQSGLF